MNKVTIHFHGGTTAVALITDEDLELEGERVRALSGQNNDGEAYESIGDPGGAEELVESVLTYPPRPRWGWIGDVFLHTQAVSGVETVGNTTEEN